MNTLADFVRDVPHFIVAHRGDAANAPENTFAAFQRVIQHGIPMLEIDVQMSADYHLVVIHDETLDRTTNGTGPVHHYTYEQLAQLSAGAWYAPEFVQEKIPLLEDVLEQCLPHCFLNIEIKPPAIAEHYPLKAIRTAEMVARYNAFDRVLFSSFHYPSLKVIKEKYPQAEVAPIRIPNTAILPSQLVQQFPASVFVADLLSVTEQDRSDILSHQIYAAYYVVNSKEELLRAMQFAAVASVSDDPIRLHAVLEAMGSEKSGDSENP